MDGNPVYRPRPLSSEAEGKHFATFREDLSWNVLRVCLARLRPTILFALERRVPKWLGKSGKIGAKLTGVL